MLESAISLEPGFFEWLDFQVHPGDIVWLLGRSFNTDFSDDREKIRDEIRSFIWLTYRKNFQPIGGVGPTTDQGWGCMLRCGQMLLAQTLLRLHLGPVWRWTPGNRDPIYAQILCMFQDKKNSLFSLHQIAQMGVSEGKAIGEWFGPNTIAHVLKKLIVYDEWSSVALHVAMDNAVVIENIRRLCHARVRLPHRRRNSSSSSASDRGSKMKPPFTLKSTQELGEKAELDCFVNQQPVAQASADDVATTENDDFEDCSDVQAFPSTSATEPRLVAAPPNEMHKSAGSDENTDKDHWRPLLLLVPLRLGLATFNPVYTHAIKEFFMLKYSLGIIGGRPNHALYFVGSIGDDLIYLDPHYCQPTVELSTTSDVFEDSSYHCFGTWRMPIASIDPSLALAFLCRTEGEFDDLCNCFRQSLLKVSEPPLFELLETQPSWWPTFVPYTGEDLPKAEFTVIDPQLDSDEEFEILS